MSTPTRKVTLATLAALRARNEKAVFITAYDYPTATFADRAGADMLLVGDSAAMTMLGLPNTMAIGLDEMLVFARAVSRGARRAFVIGEYAADVRAERFPGPEHCYGTTPEREAEIRGAREPRIQVSLAAAAISVAS